MLSWCWTCLAAATRSGAGLQLADRQMRGEDGCTGVARQPSVSFRGGLGAVTGLLELDHGVTAGRSVDRLLFRLGELGPELPHDGDEHGRGASVRLYLTNCGVDRLHDLIERDGHDQLLSRVPS